MCMYSIFFPMIPSTTRPPPHTHIPIVCLVLPFSAFKTQAGTTRSNFFSLCPVWVRCLFWSPQFSHPIFSLHCTYSFTFPFMPRAPFLWDRPLSPPLSLQTTKASQATNDQGPSALSSHNEDVDGDPKKRWISSLSMKTSCSSEQPVWFCVDTGNCTTSGFAVFTLAARKLRASCPARLANERITSRGDLSFSISLHFCSQLRCSCLSLKESLLN